MLPACPRRLGLGRGAPGAAAVLDAVCNPRVLDYFVESLRRLWLPTVPVALGQAGAVRSRSRLSVLCCAQQHMVPVLGLGVHSGRPSPAARGSDYTPLVNLVLDSAFMDTFTHGLGEPRMCGPRDLGTPGSKSLGIMGGSQLYTSGTFASEIVCTPGLLCGDGSGQKCGGRAYPATRGTRPPPTSQLRGTGVVASMFVGGTPVIESVSPVLAQEEAAVQAGCRAASKDHLDPLEELASCEEVVLARAQRRQDLLAMD